MSIIHGDSKFNGNNSGIDCRGTNQKKSPCQTLRYHNTFMCCCYGKVNNIDSVSKVFSEKTHLKCNTLESKTHSLSLALNKFVN